MANPFGEVVDDNKLNQMVSYIYENKTQEDRAREAMNLIYAEGKYTNALIYVKSLKNDYGNGVTVLCLVYNGTGETLHYVANYDWEGHIGRTPYPVEIGNGQWGAFLHVHRPNQAFGSQAAVVYRGENKDGLHRDFLIAWDIPWVPWYSNKAYCEVGGVDSFRNCWDNMNKILRQGKNSHGSIVDGCCIYAGVSGGTSPVFRAEISTPYTPSTLCMCD